MSNWSNWLMASMVLLLVVPMIYFIYQEIDDAVTDENNCIEEESYYYRIEQGLIFSSRIKTTKDKADGIDWRCIKWEEEPELSKAILGQRLIHEKGSLKEKINDTI